MRIAIMQPYFFPYMGYLALIKHSDYFVVFDTPQFIRHGWIERNRILKPNEGWQYIQVPLEKHSRNTTIKDITIKNKSDWRKKIIAQLEHYKKKAPFYNETMNLVIQTLELDTNSITRLDIYALENIFDYLNIDFKYNVKSKQNEIILNGENIEDKIRGIKVSEKVSIVSKIKKVREFLVKQQRKMGEQKQIVMDGRDIGTVVFPNADIKIFMTADAEIRAKRRFDELRAKDEKISFDEIKKNIFERDYIDQNRKESPLKKAKDAIILDNSNLSRQEQLNWILQKINEINNEN